MTTPPRSPRTSAEGGALDEAWEAAERTLPPEGWRLVLGREQGPSLKKGADTPAPFGYWATARGPAGYRVISTSADGTLQPTAAAALLELVRLLHAALGGHHDTPD